MNANFDKTPARESGVAERSLPKSEAHQALAQAAEARWSWRVAIEHWDRSAAAIKPNDLALTRKARCLMELGELDLASDVFTSLADHVAGAKGLADIGDLRDAKEEAAARWDECLERFPKHIAGFLGKTALLLRYEAFEEAEKLIARALATWPKSREAAVLSAQCATAARNWDVAATRWKDLLGKWPREPDVRRGYVRHLAAIGDRAGAVLYLETLADDPVERATRALEYDVANDDFVAAADQAKKLVDLEPAQLEYRLLLASLLMRSGAESALLAALSILKRLYQISPESVRVVAQLSEAAIRSGLDTEAQNFIQAIPAADRRAEVEILRAWLQQRKKDDEAAKKTWDAVLSKRYIPAIHAPIAELSRIDSRNIQIHRDDIVLFCVVRNEYLRLNWFLDYYRKLGIYKFVMIDNASTDDTVSLLQQNEDVILYQTPDSFSATSAGTRWVNELIDRHARQNWCLYVDADEALTFPGQQNLTLRKLADYLEWKGYEAMMAVMLDMYPAEVGNAVPGDFQAVQSSYAYFDNRLSVQGSQMPPYREVFGGARRRLCKINPIASKVPLINGKSEIKFLHRSHHTTPAKLANLTGGLLHYHLSHALQPEERALLDEAMERRELPGNSFEWLRCREILAGESASLLAEESQRFETSEQLLALAKNQKIALPYPDDFLMKFIRGDADKAAPSDTEPTKALP